MVKRLPTMQETQVQSLGWEDPLEKEMATPSSILAWKIPWMEEPGGLQSMGSQRVGHNWVTSLLLAFWAIKLSISFQCWLVSEFPLIDCIGVGLVPLRYVPLFQDNSEFEWGQFLIAE